MSTWISSIVSEIDNFIWLYAILPVDEYSPDFGLDASTYFDKFSTSRSAQVTDDGYFASSAQATDKIKELAFYWFI